MRIFIAIQKIVVQQNIEDLKNCGKLQPNISKYSFNFQDNDSELMVAGLSFKAIVELIKADNETGLRSFLETQHANVDDKNEV